MKTWPADHIQIAPERQRQEFDPQALEELKSSIEARGLMHAVVVRQTDQGPFLVAGERRLRALKDIYALDGVIRYNGEFVSHGMVPTVTLGELDPLEAEEAELDENLKRRDLTWQELANAHARLHKLRQAQKTKLVEEAPVGSVLANGSLGVQTIADTAREIHGRGDGDFGNIVRKELIVSKHLDKPEVAKAKNLDEAFKILKRSEQAEANRELAAKVGATFTAELHRLYHDNCLQWMSAAVARDEQFDVILTDPPYGMGADQFGDGGKDLPDHQYSDSYENWLMLMAGCEKVNGILRPVREGWCHLAYQLAKPEAHAYVFCDVDRFHELKKFMEDAGWYVFRTPLIDYKTDSGRVPLPDRGPRRQWEMILYAIKGDKPVTHIYPDVIPCQADPNMTHGAQKPVALYVNLLKRSVKPGDLVLDTFAGSGTIFPAAHFLQCVATGIEQEANYYGMCLRRLQTLKEIADPLMGLEVLK